MENLIEVLNRHKIENKVLKRTLPTALVMQKRKFLCAIGKGEPPCVDDRDEKYAQKYFTPKNTKKTDSKAFPSLHWTDTIATNTVKQIVSENENFDVRIYLSCAKAIFLTYSGVIPPNDTVYEAFTYVLTHARSFGNPGNNVFKLGTRGSFTTKFRDIYKPLPEGFYMSKIKMLIERLNVKYDDRKYKILNLNVTYLTLLILRRFIGNEKQFSDSFKRAQEDYVKLCPNPLTELPKISDIFNKNVQPKLLKPSAILAIAMFLGGSDEKTKKAVQATCVQYVEWTGLQLPCLFFKVVRLYGVTEAKLWDALSGLEKTHSSLYKLSKDYYQQYKKSVAEPHETAAWFPFCRALDGDFHRDLSAADNLQTCMILAYLVDLKIGFGMSVVRNSHWTKKIGDAEKEILLKETKIISEKYPFA